MYHHAIKEIATSQHGKLEWGNKSIFIRWVGKKAFIKPIFAEVNRRLLSARVTAKTERNLEAHLGYVFDVLLLLVGKVLHPLLEALRFGAWKFNQLENVSLERVAEFSHIWISGNKILHIGKHVLNCQNKCKFEFIVIWRTKPGSICSKERHLSSARTLIILFYDPWTALCTGFLSESLAQLASQAHRKGMKTCRCWHWVKRLCAFDVEHFLG